MEAVNTNTPVFRPGRTPDLLGLLLSRSQHEQEQLDRELDRTRWHRHSGVEHLPVRCSEQLQFGYRHAKISGDFIPGGETVNDGSANFDWWLEKSINVSVGVQYEKWLAPILAPTASNQLDLLSCGYFLAAPGSSPAFVFRSTKLAKRTCETNARNRRGDSCGMGVVSTCPALVSSSWQDSIPKAECFSLVPADRFKVTGN